MEILMEILLCGIMIYLLLQKAKMLIMTFYIVVEKFYLKRKKNRYSDLLLLLKIVNPYHLSALSTYYYKNIDLLYKFFII